MDFELALGGFLIGAASGSTFGWGSCWFDECWLWQPAFDHQVGAALGPPTISPDGMVFKRRWSGVNVMVNCSSAAVSLEWLKPSAP